jgi:hypothetical protein
MGRALSLKPGQWATAAIAHGSFWRLSIVSVVLRHVEDLGVNRHEADIAEATN